MPVAQVVGHSTGRAVTHFGKCRVDTGDDRVALRRHGQISCRLGKIDATFGVTNYFSRTEGCFGYQNADQYPVTLSGAGILCLELCGKHEDPDSLSAAKYLMSVYRDKLPNEGYAYYGLYYASQGLFQIGGENWKEFSDWMYAAYLPRQRGSGAWPGHGGEQSESYATAMTILAFAVPYRQLPVYQRDETVDE